MVNFSKNKNGIFYTVFLDSLSLNVIRTMVEYKFLVFLNRFRES